MILAAIILTGIGSYFMRVFFIFALARYQFPPIMLQALEYVAPTVMAALVVSLLTTPNGELIAGVPEIVGLVGTAVVAKVSGNYILALLTGMMTYWLIGWIM
jgi:branched-subunit amino acid transport protein